MSTHSPSRSRFAVVWLLLSRPSMQDWPSHHTEDIGARFAIVHT
ncbi:hypothetical protein ABZ464_39805 [Streptomyces sp. NPDC005820]